MDQDFYIEDSSPAKVIITIIIFIGLIVAGIFFYMSYKSGNFAKLNNVTVELGDKLPTNIDTYITTNNTSGYKLDLSNIVVDEKGVVTSTGEYSFKVRKDSTVKKGKVYVKDTTKPIVEIEELTVGVNENFSPNDYLVKCEDLSLPCSVRFKNNRSLELNSKEGTYETTIIISDSEGNEVEKTTRLIVSGENTLANKKASLLEYDHLSEEDEKWNKSYTLKLAKGISDESLEYDKYIDEISTKEYDFSKEIADKRILVVYNKYNYVIGFSVKVTFDDNEILYLTKDNAVEKTVEEDE